LQLVPGQNPVRAAGDGKGRFQAGIERRTKTGCIASPEAMNDGCRNVRQVAGITMSAKLSRANFLNLQQPILPSTRRSACRPHRPPHDMLFRQARRGRRVDLPERLTLKFYRLGKSGKLGGLFRHFEVAL
jgi:hypothetical protein